MISGARIATDVWDQIYPAKTDAESKATSQKFVREVLGYKWVRNHAGRKGTAMIVESTRMGTDEGEIFSFHNETNEDCYCVETPDGISPVSSRTGSTFMRYSDTDISAGVCYEGNGYRTVSLGFPIETMKNEKDIDKIISLTLEFFTK